MKKLLNILLSYLPTRLPVGVTEFDAWADSIIAITGPLADRDSMLFVISTAAVRLGPTESRKAKQYFVHVIKAAAAKQVASQVFQDIKIRQTEQAAKFAAEQQQKAEATALQQASNGNQ